MLQTRESARLCIRAQGHVRHRASEMWPSARPPQEESATCTRVVPPDSSLTSSTPTVSSCCDSLWSLCRECSLKSCPTHSPRSHALSPHLCLLSPPLHPLLASPWSQQWWYSPGASSSLSSRSCIHGVSLVVVTCLTSTERKLFWDNQKESLFQNG